MEKRDWKREREIVSLAQNIVGRIVYSQMKGSTDGPREIADEIIRKDEILASRSARIAALEHEVERYRASYGELPHDPTTDGGPLPNEPYVTGEETDRAVIWLQRRQVARDSLKG